MPLEEQLKRLSPPDGSNGAEHYPAEQSEPYEEVVNKPNVYEQIAKGEVNQDHIYAQTTNQ